MNRLVVVLMLPPPAGPQDTLACMAIAVGTNRDEELRLPTARKLGFRHVVNVQKDDLPALVSQLSNGRGADLVVEASGAEPAINQAVQLIRKQGRIAVIGLTGKPQIAFKWDAAIFKDCRIDFHISTAFECWDRTIALAASGQLNLKALISHREPLENWKAVFEDVEAQRGLKAILIP